MSNGAMPDAVRTPEEGFTYGAYSYKRGRWWYVSNLPSTRIACDARLTTVLNELYRAVDLIYRLSEAECVHCQAARDAGEKPVLSHHDEPDAVRQTREFLEARLLG